MSWIVLGMGLSDLPDWSEEKLPESLRSRYNVTATGLRGVDSGRKRFQVICIECDEELHCNTTNPTFYIEDHEKEKHK